MEVFLFDSNRKQEHNGKLEFCKEIEKNDLII